MPLVNELILHILLHVNAEASDSDSSQVPGVQGRAQLVRDAVDGLRADSRNLTIQNILQSVYNAIPAGQGRTSFRRALDNMRSEDETRPQLAIQTWVGKARETR